jgi:hypothetical protein
MQMNHLGNAWNGFLSVLVVFFKSVKVELG